jgi:hypothetical protein
MRDGKMRDGRNNPELNPTSWIKRHQLSDLKARNSSRNLLLSFLHATWLIFPVLNNLNATTVFPSRLRARPSAGFLNCSMLPPTNGKTPQVRSVK